MAARDSSGNSVSIINCERNCPEDLDETERKVFEVCMAVCDAIPIKDPVSVCGKCKKLKGIPGYLCKQACKFLEDEIGLPDVKKETCQIICCPGTLPEGIPGDECFAELYKDGKLIPDPEKAYHKCTKCCQKYEDPANPKPQGKCDVMCRLWTGADGATYGDHQLY